ncbi:MAG: phosphatase PAP2 family protein [Rhizobiaceae bacterium]
MSTTRPINAEGQADAREIRTIALIALIVAAITGAIFTLAPSLDIAASALFYTETGRFALADSEFWRFIRTVFLRGFTVWYIVISVCLFISIKAGTRVLTLNWKEWCFQVFCALAGPLLLTNMVLKDHWGRWRPREILEFGGVNGFAPPLDWGGTCLDNCSFVSGEVSSTVMSFFALALVATAWRKRLYLITALLWGVSALIRVGQGGHFLSDAIYAGIFMVLVACAIYALMFLRAESAAEDEHPQQAVSRLFNAHDRFWETVCSAGLALLDRLAPRR